jgi:glucose 1-dehydrogenase
MSLLRNRVAIVTGASSGIGRSIAVRFAAEGAIVIAADLREDPIEGGEPTVALIRREGGQCSFQRTDVSRWPDVDALVGGTVRQHGRLDIMVNNAATYTGTTLLETTEEQWTHVMAVNLTGMFFGCKRAVQQMLTQEPVAEARGRIINLSSQHGMIGAPGHVAYCAAKGGVVNLTRQLAVDFAPRGIVVNAIAPGKILTAPLDEPDTPEILEYSRARTPFPRLGQPEDVAALAVFLASDECTYMSGANVLVDGGWMAF